MGSVILLTDSRGNTKDTYSYDAFGSQYGDNSFGSSYGNGWTTGVVNEYGYNGKRFDSAVGLADYGFRDYAPQVGRFTTLDPIKDGTNWYVYVGNDPVNFIDPLGLDVYVGYDEEDILRNKRDTERKLRDSRFEEEGLTPSDQNGEWQDQFSNGLYKKDPPPGLTTEEYEDAIRDTASRYDDSDPYYPVPILKPGSSNSNSYVGTILRDTFYGSFTANLFENMTAQAVANMMKKHTAPDVPGAVGWNTDISLKNK